MQLDLIENDDIYDHARLDAKVYARCQSDCNHPPPPLAYILSIVVATAPAHLDQKFERYTAAQKIVENCSQDRDGDESLNLAKLLVSCWGRGGFKEIRCLSEHSFTNLLYLAMSYGTAEILRPIPVQTQWASREEYALFFLLSQD